MMEYDNTIFLNIQTKKAGGADSQDDRGKSRLRVFKRLIVSGLEELW